MTDDLNTAYEDAAAAGDDCYNGAGGTESLLTPFGRGTGPSWQSLLAAAVERITSVTGHTPSTSTHPAEPTRTTRSGAEAARSATCRRRGRTRPRGRDPDEYDRLRRRVLWSMPTGLFVVGSRAGDRRNLMTATG